MPDRELLFTVKILIYIKFDVKHMYVLIEQIIEMQQLFKVSIPVYCITVPMHQYKLLVTSQSFERLWNVVRISKASSFMLE